jgi:prepilin-type N-terminal cleavage/methylation domain-containing protein
MNKKSGFTLLEMLLVIAIIAILAAIVIIAINPSKQLADSNNARRHSDVRAIYKALQQYTIDTGFIMSDIPTLPTEVCDTGDAVVGHGINCGDFVDLSRLVPNYLSSIPKDPLGPSGRTYEIVLQLFTKNVYAAGGAGYFVAQPLTGAPIVVAPLTQNIDAAGNLIQAGSTEPILLKDFTSPESDSGR